MHFVTRAKLFSIGTTKFGSIVQRQDTGSTLREWRFEPVWTHYRFAGGLQSGDCATSTTWIRRVRSSRLPPALLRMSRTLVMRSPSVRHVFWGAIGTPGRRRLRTGTFEMTAVGMMVGVPPTVGMGLE